MNLTDARVKAARLENGKNRCDLVNTGGLVSRINPSLHLYM